VTPTPASQPPAEAIQASKLAESEFDAVLYEHFSTRSQKVDFCVLFASALIVFAANACGDVEPLHYYQLSNEGFYMAPNCAVRMKLDKGSTVDVSADAAGVILCQFALQEMGENDPSLADAAQRLRAFAAQHAEAEQIRAVIRAVNGLRAPSRS
jgi:hypothetical protein